MLDEPVAHALSDIEESIRRRRAVSTKLALGPTGAGASRRLLPASAAAA
ncbi:hypothetical protein [Mycolicibacterium tusciae]|nr:hypothetical protein [Mycolicibacterium tusciae]